ncbi:hypothetical protein K7G68_08920 [Micrococcus luteus]|uniref:hypothetical protein n=1 Tax=Micrococcus luteus TaxID=1270 RepID=UPI001CA61937|nr:hypothetical protein [Micrococcus luteus]QZY83674.1 hypothetical protein K7G68_08920 [Micrococcus luteus]
MTNHDPHPEPLESMDAQKRDRARCALALRYGLHPDTITGRTIPEMHQAARTAARTTHEGARHE